MSPAHSNPLHRLRASLYFWRGNLHRHFGNLSSDRREYQAAVDDFSQAINLYPAYVSAYYSRGILYWRELQNFYRAVRDMTRVIELAPYWHEAWFNRAIAHQLRGEIPEAIADFEQYLTLAGNTKWRSSAENQLEMIRAVAAEREELKRAR